VPTDCNAVFKQARDNLAKAVEETSTVIYQAPLPVVLGDEVQLLQVFQNLIANAIKFRGAEAPQIQVTADRQGPEWVSHRDNGIGITGTRSVFSIFHACTNARVSRYWHRSGHLQKIVERHGGRIWVESQPQGLNILLVSEADPK
jgi:light-regulated signal transduction histidine kinase (bacteriophytochrome)